MTNWSDTLCNELAHQFGIAVSDLDWQANLLQLGLDSIDLIGWLHRFHAEGWQVSMQDLYRRPSIQGWLAVLQNSEKIDLPAIKPASHWKTMPIGEAFPLTSVQHAYLVGRSPQQVLGGVGCYLYQEFNGYGLGSECLELALQKLVRRHPMLSVAFRSDGSQFRLPEPAWDGLVCHDLRNHDENACNKILLQLREQLSHQLLDVESGHCISFDLVLLPGGRHRLLTGIDLLVADAISYAQLFDELATLVAGRELIPLDPNYDFFTYLQHRQHVTRDDRKNARHYWMTQLSSLPSAPSLPLICDPAQAGAVRIHRREYLIQPEKWQAFKRHAGEVGLTPTMALATCFGAVLSRWSGQSRLLLNLTLFDRRPLHSAVAQIVADFTNILLLNMHCESASFVALARENQQTFASACEHNDYSGVEVMRELKKLGGHPYGAPIVFTSNLGRPLIGDSAINALGELGWGISQTPQVWIDHMALEQRGSVLLRWDCNEALFPPNLLEDLFNYYTEWVENLCSDFGTWQRPLPDDLPDTQQKIRKRVNATDTLISEKLLHEEIFSAARTHNEKIAIVYGDKQFSHAEIAAQACGLSWELRKAGIVPGTQVGICMPKNAGQVVAALAVLHAGATYVPVDIEQPLVRISQICTDAKLSILVICAQDPNNETYAPALPRMSWQQAKPLTDLEPVTVDPDEAAYIIYTSGSTGHPKGVAVSHRAALNTCLDINRRYGIGTNDRMLALSALHFDLSVYDLFGVLSAGGGIVLVGESHRRDPSTWCDLIVQHNVTLWNTVPMLFDMLLTYAEAFELNTPSQLRLVLLSGDWVGLDLPNRYHAYAPTGRFVALGGATEAAIWSNAYEVGEVPPHWRSIPYGTPLANQRYRVVDALGRDCPDWVEGELWIGGVGVALGYFNDFTRTQIQFVNAANGRWYRTGDMGRYWPDGTLEFLGRRDKQVKIGGYRIELGEIDNALSHIKGVKTGLSLAIGERDKKLIAYVVPQGDTLLSRVGVDPRMPTDYAQYLMPPDAEIENESDERNMGAVGDFLHQHFRLQNIDFTNGLTVAQAADNYGCITVFRPLFKDWLDMMAKQGYLKAEDNRYYWSQPNRKFIAKDESSSLIETLVSYHHTLSQIVCGLRSPVTLLEHPHWAPEQVALRLAGFQYSITTLAHAVKRLADCLGRPVRLVELGCRSGFAAAHLLQYVDAAIFDYIGLDESADMVLRARKTLLSHSNATIRHWKSGEISNWCHSADVVWLNNSLHRQPDLDSALADVTTLAAAGGLIYVVEPPALPIQGLISVELFANEQKRPKDQLKNEESWQKLWAKKKFHLESTRCTGDLLLFMLRAPENVWVPKVEALQNELSKQLPSYMVPARVHFLDAMPLTSNGKIDYRKLLELDVSDNLLNAPEEPPATLQEKSLASLWQRMLDQSHIHRHSDFFQLGGDSLLATRLIGELERIGYVATLGDLFTYPLLSAFAATLQKNISKPPVSLAIDQEQRHEPFPLTDLQQAYLVGRQRGFALGGIGSHFFMKFMVENLDVARFDAVWNQLIVRHDMLRAVVRNGMQQILPEVPYFEAKCYQFKDLAGVEAQALHEEISHTIYDPARWPVFGVHIGQNGGHISHVYISLDNLLLDGMSMQILFSELKQLYIDPTVSLPSLGIGFRDYLMRPSAPEAHAEALAYWRTRLPHIPAAPKLPLRCDPINVVKPKFVRLSASLSSETWKSLRAAASEHQITPSSLLLAAYATVLSAWSAQPELSINLTLFDRRPVHPDIEHVLGDFTSLLLLAWKPQASWLESALTMQRRLRSDLVYREVSAIRVMREMAARDGVVAVDMPVVFTSALGYDPQQGFLDHQSWLRPIDGLSQTPQTWMDHQVYESGNTLYYNWDAVEQLFEPDMLHAMFTDYSNLLECLAHDTTIWDMQWDLITPRRTIASEKLSTLPEVVQQPTAIDELEKETEAWFLVEQLRQYFTETTGCFIAAQQNFFDAGATSLQLVQLHAHLHNVGYSTLEVTELFAHPSPYALARRLLNQDTISRLEQSNRKTLLDSRQSRRARRIELRS